MKGEKHNIIMVLITYLTCLSVIILVEKYGFDYDRNIGRKMNIEINKDDLVVNAVGFKEKKECRRI